MLKYLLVKIQLTLASMLDNLCTWQLRTVKSGMMPSILLKSAVAIYIPGTL